MNNRNPIFRLTEEGILQSRNNQTELPEIAGFSEVYSSLSAAKLFDIYTRAQESPTANPMEMLALENAISFKPVNERISLYNSLVHLMAATVNRGDYQNAAKCRDEKDLFQAKFLGLLEQMCYYTKIGKGELKSGAMAADVLVVWSNGNYKLMAEIYPKNAEEPLVCILQSFRRDIFKERAEQVANEVLELQKEGYNITFNCKL